MTNQTDVEIRVRPAVGTDLNTLVDFNAAMARETEDKVLDRDRLRTGVAAVLQGKDRGFYLVAESDGRVVGQLLVTTEWSDWRNGYFWWIQSVYVHQDYRGRGVYRTLHRHVETEARRQSDVCGLRLYVVRDNLVAQEVYARLDMRQCRYDMYETDFTQ